MICLYPIVLLFLGKGNSRAPGPIILIRHWAWIVHSGRRKEVRWVAGMCHHGQQHF